MINVIATLHIKAGRVAEFLEIFKANVPNVLKEKGCIEYAPTVDVATGIAVQDTDANAVTIVEKWNSVDDLKAHLVAPHMQAYSEKVKGLGLLEKRSIKILGAA
jgi:quinol monooxygenase YgiN